MKEGTSSGVLGVVKFYVGSPLFGDPQSLQEILHAAEVFKELDKVGHEKARRLLAHLKGFATRHVPDDKESKNQFLIDQNCIAYYSLHLLRPYLNNLLAQSSKDNLSGEEKLQIFESVLAVEFTLQDVRPLYRQVETERLFQHVLSLIRRIRKNLNVGISVFVSQAKEIFGLK